MDAIETRDFVFLQELRRFHVRGDHALFDQSMSVIAGNDFNPIDFAIVIKFEFCLREINFDRAATATLFSESFVQIVQVSYRSLQLFWYRGLRCAAQEISNLAVGQARFRFHHAFEESRFAHFTGRADTHVAHHTKSINLRIK